MRLMDAGAGACCDALMMDDRACLRLVLELEVDRDPVRGWLESADGARERFEGLLGLLVALDAARAGDRASEDARDERVGEG